MERQALPLIPVPFRLVVRQVRTEEGYVTDPVAIRQLEVLRGLLENADALVIATDAGREGELVSRYLLDYLGYRKPALRVTRNFAASLFRNIKYFTLRKLYLCRKWMQKRLQKTTTTGITLPNFDFLA